MEVLLILYTVYLLQGNYGSGVFICYCQFSDCRFFGILPCPAFICQ
jgi:hypothetical protein